MLCKKYAKADFVISTGTNLESLRFRSKIASALKVPVSKVQGWVGGEHGDAAVPLWSTIKIDNMAVDEYLSSKGASIPRDENASYVKSVSKLIIDNIGGTEYGPAASFRDIAKAITKNTNEVLSIAAPAKFEEIPEPVFVGIPTHLGQFVGTSLYGDLAPQEKVGIKAAAKAIYQTYETAINNLDE
jgi:malate dehydrogenase